MVPKSSLWKDNYDVCWHDTDQDGNISFAAIARYLQETAWHQAEKLGFGYQKALKLGQFWALVRQHIRMDKFPRWSDHLVIETWSRGIDGLWAFRDYYLRDGNDPILGRVTSSWMVIDQKTRRPQKPEIVYDALTNIRPEKALGFDAPRLEWKESWMELEKRRVRYSDLDQNGHVNNSRIVEWIFDAVRKYNEVFSCVEFSINFISEIKQEDVVSLQSSGSQFPVYVKGVRKEQDTLLFIAKLS